MYVFKRIFMIDSSQWHYSINYLHKQGIHRRRGSYDRHMIDKWFYSYVRLRNRLMSAIKRAAKLKIIGNQLLSPDAVSLESVSALAASSSPSPCLPSASPSTTSFTEAGSSASGSPSHSTTESSSYV